MRCLLIVPGLQITIFYIIEILSCIEVLYILRGNIYYHMHDLGFLFLSPAMRVSPGTTAKLLHCGQGNGFEIWEQPLHIWG